MPGPPSRAFQQFANEYEITTTRTVGLARLTLVDKCSDIFERVSAKFIQQPQKFVWIQAATLGGEVLPEETFFIFVITCCRNCVRVEGGSRVAIADNRLFTNPDFLTHDTILPPCYRPAGRITALKQPLDNSALA
ncbi:MAG: hypothetical protein LAN83_12520 [Acidobacteriia bacterium]|nr:hypothetical protein [Terriglobia bacterium]